MQLGSPQSGCNNIAPNNRIEGFFYCTRGTKTDSSLNFAATRVRGRCVLRAMCLIATDR